MQLIKKNTKKLSGNSSPSHTVLALVGDTQVGLWVVRSLARNGLTVHAVVHSRHGQSAHSRFAASAWILDQSPGSKEFIRELKELARDLGAGSIMPIAESYHKTLIEHRSEFEPEIHIFSPPKECFEKATDKDYMHSLCKELKIPVARGRRLDEIIQQSDINLRFPLVLRTRRQNVQGGQIAPWKAAYAKDKDQLRHLYSQVKDIAENVIVQEYHPGVEDHVQILMHNGEAFMYGEYIGIHHMPLAGGVTVLRESCYHPDMVNDAVRLLKAIDYSGIGGVQFHLDPKSGKYIFLEINPRFIGGLPTVIMAGFEAPFLLWQSHFEPNKMKKTKYKLGLRTRILGGDANWMFGMIRGDQLPPGEKRLGKIRTISEFLWHSGPWTRDDSFMLTDPKPFFVDLFQMVKKFGSQAFDIIGNPHSQES